MKDLRHISTISIGEVLYDMFPEGRQPGGAPMNVALCLANFGVKSAMISRVGADEYGKELIAFLQNRSVDTSLIQIDKSYPTGTVRVKLGGKTQDPEYIIVEHTAWDFIDDSFTKELLAPAFIIHGSLACRSDNNFRAIKKLTGTYKSKVVFDMNLRSPFYSKLILEELLSRCHILKVNLREFERLKEWYNIDTNAEERSLIRFQKLFPNIETILLTKRSKGAAALHHGEYLKTKAIPIEIKDTVGSGDAFLGAFLSQYHKQKDIKDALELASFTGAYVATQTGANPAFDEKDILAMA